MRTRLAGDISLTELGMGAAQLGNLYRETTEQEALGAVVTSWDAGVRYFDTAPHYGIGLSERRIGAALAAYPREDYVISTKVGRRLVPTPENAHLLDDEGFATPAAFRREWDFSCRGVIESVESSLDRLGLDRIDIAFLHDPDDYWREASTTGIAALQELKRKGVVGAIGAAMNHAPQLTRFVETGALDIVMLAGRFTLLEQGAMDALLPAALRHDVAVIAAGAYNSGLLSTAVVPADAMYEYEQAPARLVERTRAIAAVCEEHGVSLPEAAVQFPLRHRAVVSVVLGTRSPQDAASNARRYGTDVPAELWRTLGERGLIRVIPEADLSRG